MRVAGPTGRGAPGPSTWTGPPVPPGAVVVALDGSPADHGAVRWGAAQALPAGRRLHLVHVVQDGVPVVADVAGTVVMPPPDLLSRSAATARARARALVDAVAPGAGVSVVTGHTVPLLVAASRGSHLLVLGDSRLRAAPARTGDQVAVFLAVRARCPVVVVPSFGDPVDLERGSGLREMARRREVVLGVDGTHAGRGALELAFAHAGAHGCDLRVVHVWPPRRPSRPEPDLGWVQRRAMVSELLAGHRERHPDVLVLTDLVRGDPVPALVGRGRAWQAELLVLSGCHGQGRRGLLPGPVTLGVLDRARCPVAMVRDGGVGEHLWHRPTRVERTQEARGGVGAPARA